MDVAFILKIAGVGLVVSVVCQILSKSGRDDQSMLVSIAGILVVLLMLVTQMRELFSLIKSVFGLS